MFIALCGEAWDNQRTGRVGHTRLVTRKSALAMAEIALQKTALENETTHHIAACQGNQNCSKETLTKRCSTSVKLNNKTDRPGCTGARYHFAADKSRLCFLDIAACIIATKIDGIRDARINDLGRNTTITVAYTV